MPPAFQASYDDYVTGADGRAVAGATVALYPVGLFPDAALPTSAPSFPPSATATTGADGRFLFSGLPPADYHVLVQYTPHPQPLPTLTIHSTFTPKSPFSATHDNRKQEVGSALCEMECEMG